MTSTNDPTPVRSAGYLPAWKRDGLRYHAYSHYLRSKFGGRVQKVSIDAGFTCPNVDGTVAKGGCTFCNNRSFSPSRRVPRQKIVQQIEDGIVGVKRRYNCNDFIAYFQPATNTFADVDRLRETYFAALEHPQVVAMAIGTRPDCVPEGVLDLLSEVAARVPLSVELGVQTIHDRSLRWMNRGHDYACFPDAVQRCRGRGFEISTHIILGLPGESHADMMASADEMARLKLDAIKIHNLYAVGNTPLADQVASGEVELMQRDTYVRTLVDFIERLPPEMVVDRVSGEAPPEYFIGPSWCLDKPGVLGAIRQEFERRDTWQGLIPAQAGI